MKSKQHLFSLVALLVAGCDNLCPANPACEYHTQGGQNETDAAPDTIDASPCDVVAFIYSRDVVSSAGEDWPPGPPSAGWSWTDIPGGGSGWSPWGGPSTGAPAKAHSDVPWTIGRETVDPLEDLSCEGCDIIFWAVVTGTEFTGSVRLTHDGVSTDYPLQAADLDFYNWRLMTADVSARGLWEWPATVSWIWPSTINPIGYVPDEGTYTYGGPLANKDQKPIGNAAMGFMPSTGACAFVEGQDGVDGGD